MERMTAHDHIASASPRTRGRPRQFDMDEALDKAVRVFSERGYHGASITDLTRTMGLSQGSIYKAFRDKEGVFLAAFRRYRAARGEKLRRTVGNEGSGRDRLRRALGFYVQSSQGAEGLMGCLVVAGAAELSTFEPEAARQIAAAFEQNEAFLRDLVRQGQEDGSISAQLDPDAAARMLLCLAQGMRVVGKTGRSAEEMQAAVEVALRALD